MRVGVRLGIDVGSVRIGVARSDPDGTLATPVTTVAATDDTGGLGEVAALVREWEAMEVVVGLPLSLSGAPGAAAERALSFAGGLAALVAPTPVRLLDERFSTVAATRGLRDAGVRGRRQRGVVDQAAAVVILQGGLDAERASGRPSGRLVKPAAAPESPAQ